MSSKKKSFRVPEDSYRGLKAMADDDEDMTPHRAGVLSMEEGLREFGYGVYVNRESDWFGEAVGESGKTMAYVGLGAFVATPFADQIVLWFAAAFLGCAALALLAEQNQERVHRWLGLPDQPPWDDEVTTSE